VMDAASRTCAVIDPQPALFDRIRAYVRCQGVQVRAVLATSAESEVACAALRSVLGVVASDADVPLGKLTLVRVVPPGANVCYLLGASSAAADVRFAFCGAATSAQLSALVHGDTILCASRDDKNLICTTLNADAAVRPAFGSERHLDAQALEQFLLAHPDAVLIDVREPYEHAANGAPCCHGRVAESVPLSRLAGRLQAWLDGEQRPLVFFCRAGNRSARAAQCAHRLGLANAWQMTGGLALGDAVLVPLAMAA
jgi:cysteine desulfurase